MTSYRQSMNQTLDFMRFMQESKILERELTDNELKRREQIAKALPDEDFKNRYGKDWMSVKMATATKIAKAEEVEMDDEEDEEDDEEERLIRPGGLREKADVSLKKKAEKSGISAGILKQVYNRGVAAWRTGHRPGTTPEQWGHARVNSFISKSSGTWGGADKDLAAKARGQKEEVELDEAKYDLYHKDFSSAMQHSYKMAKKMYGITVDRKEIDDKVASGPRKPSEGKTNTYRLKGDKGAIQVQVYNKGGSKPFELNMYKEEVDLEEGKMQDVWQKKNAKSLSVGPFELIRGKGGVSTIKRSGKVIGDFSYDDEADNFVANIKGERAQWVGDDIDSLFTHLQKNHKESVMDIEEKVQFDNADFMLGFLYHWSRNPTTKYEPHLANYVKKLIPAKNRQYAYTMIAQQIVKLIRGGMPAVNDYARQTKSIYDKMDSKVKKHLMKGMKEEVELDESVIDKVKQVASKKQAMKIDGVMVDTFTASAISQIYDKVNDANKKKMDKLPITKLASLAMKMMQKNEFTPEELDDKDKPVVKKIVGKLKKASQAHAGQADALQKAMNESAASDARRAMRRDPDMKQRGFSKDVSATDDDVKGASKNIMMQMRKAQSLRGRFDVEFADGKKVRIPEKVAIAVQQKYNAMRKPSDKEKFQAQVAKSYKSMLSALKEGFASDAQRKAAFASGYKEKGKKNKKESILDRIDNKLKERKNG